MDRTATSSVDQLAGQPDNSVRRSAGTLQRRRVQLHWPADREFRILSIDGGGIRGILPAAFLAELEDRYLQGNAIGGYFDLVAGTSTGGIIALGLGRGLTARELLNLYIDRGLEIFPPAAWPWFEENVKGAVVTRFDQERLRSVMRETLGDGLLGISNLRLCIPSADGRYGDVYIFKTPHHRDYQKDWLRPMVDIATATAAAPTYFKPYNDGTFHFVDGGLWANDPVMVALVDALACFDVERHRVRILSLGCGPGQFTLGWAKRKLGGWVPWRDAIIGAMDLQSLNAQGQAGLLIGRERLVRVDGPRFDPPIKLDNYARASTELPAVARELADTYGAQVHRDFLQAPATPYESLYPNLSWCWRE